MGVDILVAAIIAATPADWERNVRRLVSEVLLAEVCGLFIWVIKPIRSSDEATGSAVERMIPGILFRWKNFVTRQLNRCVKRKLITDAMPRSSF